jgi:2-polyprenyl-3-methyl-5-hydroxy-6-metoxy-1,4-benzoquinol methylase
MGGDWLLRTRIDAEEWLDHGLGTAAAIDRSLADLNRINRWLGGLRSLTYHLYPRLRRWSAERLTILDLGAGGCAMPLAIARWGRAQGLCLRIVALDIQGAHLRWARRRTQRWPEIHLLQGDARRPPVAAGGVDVVISSLFLHHFSPAALQELVPLWHSLARRSTILNDLVRHPVPYWFIKAAAPLFARSPITRHDAAVSLRRAYTPGELHAIIAQAGLAGARLFTHAPYRMTLVIDHEGALP